MRLTQSLLCLLCFVSICSFSACKMTEAQIRSLPPELRQELSATAAIEAEAAPVPKQKMPLGLVFAGLALLVGAVIYLKAEDTSPDRAPKTKRTKRASKSRKKS